MNAISPRRKRKTNSIAPLLLIFSGLLIEQTKVDGWQLSQGSFPSAGGYVASSVWGARPLLCLWLLCFSEWLCFGSGATNQVWAQDNPQRFFRGVQRPTPAKPTPAPTITRFPFLRVLYLVPKPPIAIKLGPLSSTSTEYLPCSAIDTAPSPQRTVDRILN